MKDDYNQRAARSERHPRPSPPAQEISKIAELHALRARVLLDHHGDHGVGVRLLDPAANPPDTCHLAARLILRSPRSIRALAFSGQAKTFARAFARLSQPELI
jgi:hypothetical protein